MRFYNQDGSLRNNNNEECDFGWWLDDFKDNDNVSSDSDDPDDSLDLKRLFKFTEQLIIEKHEPSVEICPVVSVEESGTNFEGYVDDGDLKSEWVHQSGSKIVEFRNSRLLNAFKKQLHDLIPCNTLESKLLMSIIDSSKFKKLNGGNSPFSDEELHPSYESSALGTTNFRTLHNPNVEEIPLSYKKKHNIPSLSLGTLKDCRIECNVYASTEFLYKNLNMICTRVQEMQEELIIIRRDFEVEDKRITQLMKESRKLRQEFQESNYLNEVLLLLMGQVEKLKSNNWPFKICSKRNEELNLIV